MSYKVTLCDAAFADVRNSSIQLEATTPKGVVLSSSSNGAIAGGYGTTLSFSPARQRFNIEIDTTGTSYAPLVLEDLNGDRSPQTINVILLSVPTGAGGRRPRTSADVQQYINQQGWSDDQAGAIYATMKTLAYFKRQSHRGLSRIRQNAQTILDGIGINPDLVTV